MNSICSHSTERALRAVEGLYEPGQVERIDVISDGVIFIRRRDGEMALVYCLEDGAVKVQPVDEAC